MDEQTQPGGGLTSMIGNLTGDIMRDYQTARGGLASTTPQVQQASQNLSNTFMEGYDPAAYDAQAWSSAGIGAAQPTISALESLNRAIAGYSGVKLQQRADLGKRIQAQKEAELAQAAAQQKMYQETQKDAAQQLIDLYKAGMMSKSDLAKALSERYVNVAGRGLVDKYALANGEGDAVVVPSLNPAVMFQKLMSDVASEMEQDKNMHFNSKEERDAAILATAKNRWRTIYQSSDGVLPENPFGGDTSFMQETPPPAPTAPAPQSGKSILDVPLPASEMKLMPGEVPPGAGEDARLNLKPVYGGGIKTDIKPSVGLAPIETAQQEVPAAPWTKYALTPYSQKSLKPSTGVYDKVATERAVAQNAQAEKNAEDAYSDIAKQAGATSQWLDTLRELESTDLSAVGSLAEVRNAVGKFLETVGVQNYELAKSSRDLSKINSLLMSGIQSRLSVQNGVQAKDDATREMQSFAQISDPKTVFKGLLQQAKAKSARLIERDQFYQTWKADKGTYQGASAAWNNYIKDTPLFAMYAGQPVYYNQFIDAYVAKNKAAFEKKGIPPQKQYEIASDAWKAVALKRRK